MPVQQRCQHPQWTLDLKDFYLCSELPYYEYVRIPTHMLPPAILELYQLKSKIYNGYVYAEERKGMYGLLHYATKQMKVLMKVKSEV
jgi:hypothetical protein